MTATPLLVSTNWLDAHRDDADLVLLDASVFLDRATGLSSGYETFLNDGHLPGARFADLLADFSDTAIPLPFTRPTQTQFEQAAGRLGIRPESHVVIYDGLVGQWAARLWWVFHSFGHAAVSVLDGGLRKYVAEDRPLTTGPATPVKPTSYQAHPGARRYASVETVIAAVNGQQAAQLICFLLPADYEGTVSVRRRAGHIPGSVNLPFTRLIDEDSNTLLPPEALREVFSSVADLDGPPIITYCGGGVASTLGSLALAVIGHHRTAEFDGSLAEWVQDPQRPLHTGK